MYRTMSNLTAFWVIFQYFLVQFALGQNTGWTSNQINNSPLGAGDGVKFYLYKNKDDTDERHQIICNDDLSLVNSGYNNTMPLILMTHGVLSNSLTHTDVGVVKNAYLANDFPANLVMVDYGDITTSHLPFLLSPLSILKLLYSHGQTDLIASQLAEFVIFLMKSKVLSGPENVHMIGFSLGAHVSGTAGRHIQERTGRKIRRISGLDPSPQVPLNTVKLDRSDADFVDVTLTSLGLIATVFREGHVQFYMNGGGPHQPNCPNFAPFTETYCSHTTAPFYFAKSIKRKDIAACKCGFTCSRFTVNCNEQILYGQYTPETSDGRFYVKIS